ncbi:MAG: SDR family NAD(P)-dependent oxidoreductase [Nevskia sp.]|nr:SDR family NAD(P)-dependent oxidoreductase [Nevskia sp.]
MQLADTIAVVTGAAQGIGRALAERFLREGAKAVVMVDIKAEAVREAAAAIGARAMACDVADAAAVARLVDTVEREVGPIDLFCSNAGVARADPDPHNAASASEEEWQREWAINLMAHVYAARALLPRMIARKRGYFLNTASAAGLLTQIGSAPYSVTKHAAVGFAESLAITHRDDGIRVSVLCPQAVDTPLLRNAEGGAQNVDGVLSPGQVADIVVEAIAAERFLVLPHPQVLTYMGRKASDYDRWISGMARLRRATLEGTR